MINKFARALGTVDENSSTLNSESSGTQKPENQGTEVDEKRGPGRPSNGMKARGYRQTTVWVEPELLKKVKVKLAEDDQEFSGVIDGLLREWVTR
jgi:hypothetical protein